jgi:hypothetical protein
MQIGALFKGRKLVVGLLAAAAIALGGYVALRRPDRVAMEQYVPADSLGFVEVNSIPDLIDGMTGTRAWRELAPLLGVSSQWRQVGSITSLIGRSGLGPDEAVLAGRAQCAVVVTGVETQAKRTEEGPLVHLRPKVALIIETHLSESSTATLVRERSSIVAERIFGAGVGQSTQSYDGRELRVFGPADSDRRFVVGSARSVLILGNGEGPVKQCLDVIAGRTPSLSGSPPLRLARESLAGDAAVFAFATPGGLRQMIELSPIVMEGGASAETVGAAVSLLEHLASQASDGLAYSLEFANGGVRERFLWEIRQQVAEGLIEAAPPSKDRNFDLLKAVPRDIEEISLIRAQDPGELPERLLERLASRVDVVIAIALRELVKNFRQEYGLAPSDRIGDALKDAALIDFGDEDSRALLFKVNDRERLRAPLLKYLSAAGKGVQTFSDRGVEVMVSPAGEDRAAAFVDDVLVLGTREQIGRVIGAAPNDGGSLSSDNRLKAALESTPDSASVVTLRLRETRAGGFMLALSKLLRVTDGSPELLDRQDVREVLDRLPRPRSFTELRDSGVYSESESAVGNLGRLAELFDSSS